MIVKSIVLNIKGTPYEVDYDIIDLSVLRSICRIYDLGRSYFKEATILVDYDVLRDIKDLAVGEHWLLDPENNNFEDCKIIIDGYRLTFKKK